MRNVLRFFPPYDLRMGLRTSRRTVQGGLSKYARDVWVYVRRDVWRDVGSNGTYAETYGETYGQTGRMPRRMLLARKCVRLLYVSTYVSALSYVIIRKLNVNPYVSPYVSMYVNPYVSVFRVPLMDTDMAFTYGRRTPRRSNTAFSPLVILRIERSES